MERIRRFGRFTLLSVEFTIVIALGWEIAWAIFRGYFPIEGLLIFSFPFGIIAAAAFSLFVRRCPRERKRLLIRTLFAAAPLATVSVVGLHCSRRPADYKFLRGFGVPINATANVPWLKEQVYTLRGNIATISEEARSELVPQGYELFARNGSPAVTLSKGDGDMTGGYAIYIEPGRLVGKHWLLDGDMMDIDRNAKDWVTIDVIQPDSLPIPLCVLIP